MIFGIVKASNPDAALAFAQEHGLKVARVRVQPKEVWVAFEEGTSEADVARWFQAPGQPPFPEGTLLFYATATPRTEFPDDAPGGERSDSSLS